MSKGYDKEFRKGRITDIITSMHQGYLYDMPVSRHTLKSYTTMVRTPMVFDISNSKIS